MEFKTYSCVSELALALTKHFKLNKYFLSTYVQPRSKGQNRLPD